MLLRARDDDGDPPLQHPARRTATYSGMTKSTSVVSIRRVTTGLEDAGGCTVVGGVGPWLRKVCQLDLLDHLVIEHLPSAISQFNDTTLRGRSAPQEAYARRRQGRSMAPTRRATIRCGTTKSTTAPRLSY